MTSKKEDLFLMISNEVRYCILCNLFKTGEKKVNDLQACAGTSQSNISQQLSKLKSYNIIECRRSGNEIYYSLTNKQMIKLIKFTMEELDD